MPIADIGDAELHYEVTGDGEPLILITGMGGLASYWSPQIEAFSKKFRVLAFDQRGTGRSSHSRIRYTLQRLVDDTIALMDKLDIESASFVGHSTGGMMLQLLAWQHPGRVRSQVLYGSRGRTDGFTRRVMGMRRDLVLAAGLKAYVESTPVFLYPSDWIRANNAQLTAKEETAVAASAPVEIVASRLEAVLEHDQIANLGRIEVPTLVTCARDDFLTPMYYSEELASLIPGAQLQFVPAGGHACSQTNAVTFNAMVLDFLARHEARSSAVR